jgi:hypothetical protein
MTHSYEVLFNKLDAEMLRDADETITRLNLWDWLKSYTPDQEKGFVLSKDWNLSSIIDNMKYTGHSGSSFSWTMRQMEYIAKNGWTEFVKIRIEITKREEIVERLRNLWIEGKMSYADFAKIRDTA